MKPVLKRLHSPDAYDLKSYAPPKGKPFSCLLQAMFAPEGAEGAESFDIVVCNLEWVTERIHKSGPFIGRHHLIVNEFHLEEVRNVILSFAEQCEGNDWKEVGEKLSRLGHWEFEDYRP